MAENSGNSSEEWEYFWGFDKGAPLMLKMLLVKDNGEEKFNIEYDIQNKKYNESVKALGPGQYKLDLTVIDDQGIDENKTKIYAVKKDKYDQFLTILQYCPVRFLHMIFPGEPHYPNLAPDSHLQAS